ncbi:MAG: hypothetical protein ACR2KX_12685 [Chitinophagaceae bacterium]
MKYIAGFICVEYSDKTSTAYYKGFVQLGINGITIISSTNLSFISGVWNSAKP